MYVNLAPPSSTYLRHPQRERNGTGHGLDAWHNIVLKGRAPHLYNEHARFGLGSSSRACQSPISNGRRGRVALKSFCLVWLLRQAKQARTQARRIVGKQPGRHASMQASMQAGGQPTKQARQASRQAGKQAHLQSNHTKHSPRFPYGEHKLQTNLGSSGTKKDG